MTSIYHAVTVDEFERKLSAYNPERADVPRVKEYVYDIPTDADGIVVRLFSTLTEDGAREAGLDAIRTMAWSVTADAPLAQATRTLRIETWAENLRPKIDDMIARAEAGEFDDLTPDSVLSGLVPADPAEDAVVVDDLFDTTYGRKAALASPYEAKDDIKALDWEETHRAWDKDRKCWTVDATALPLVEEALAEAGWPLRAPAPEEVDPDAFDIEAFIDGLDGDEHIVVDYTVKKHGTEKSVAGTVLRAGEGRVTFARDGDDHRLHLTSEGLYTSGSHYPYMGKVDDVTVD